MKNLHIYSKLLDTKTKYKIQAKLKKKILLK